MEENKVLSEQDEALRRKKRIKKIKRIIVIVVFFLLVFPTVLCILLFIKVHQLEGQVSDYKEAVEVAMNNKEKDNQNTNLIKDAIDVAASIDKVNDNKSEVKKTDEEIKKEKEEAFIKEAEADPNVKKVYLTFDDGPSESTGKILNILKKYNVKATFFVTGKTTDYDKKMMQRIVNEGHTIGMHSYCHDYDKIYKSVDAFEEDYYKIHDLIYDVTGVNPVYYRFPGGSSTTTTDIDIQNFIDFLDSQKVIYYDWNAQNGDATNTVLTQQELIDNILNDVKNYSSSVVLMHDMGNKENTVKSLPKLIKKLEKMDAVLLPIGENTKVVRHVKDANDKD